MLLGVSLVSAFLVVSPCQTTRHVALWSSRCNDEEEPAASRSQLDRWSRQLAIDALIPVVKPSLAAVPAEKALKRTLRSLSASISISLGDQRYMRKRVADLILGTSIYRRRYEYLIHMTGATEQEQSNGEIVGGTLLQSLLLSRPGHRDDDDNDKSVVARMVDLHILQSLQQTNLTDETFDDDDDDDDINNIKIPWPVDAAERLSVQYSLPLFLAQALITQYGAPQAASLARVMNRPGPITVRRNALQCGSDNDLIERLRDECNVSVSVLENVYLLSDDEYDDDDLDESQQQQPMPTWRLPPGCLRLSRPSTRGNSDHPQPSIWSMEPWRDGWFEVQDVGSQLIVQATEARPGEVIVDYCAGNGGKTLALASMVGSRYRSSGGNEDADVVRTVAVSHIWAHDTVPERLAQIKGSLLRAGLFNHDSIQVHMTSSAFDDLNDDLADIVLVDAPCSSSGVLRRRPSQRWMMSEDETRHILPALQLDILRKAARLVKPGGRLVYATCSILKWENEDVAAAWEKEASEEWQPWPFDTINWPTGILAATNDKLHHKRLLPHVHDSDGFFIARWKRS